jgi:hypothetical protein
MLLFCSTLLKHGRHFDYQNQHLNMRMRVCYLDCHETGLCCYLVIHIENLLRPLQLFYFHLWPIYWLSLVHDFLPLWYLLCSDVDYHFIIRKSLDIVLVFYVNFGGRGLPTFRRSTLPLSSVLKLVGSGMGLVGQLQGRSSWGPRGGVK